MFKPKQSRQTDRSAERRFIYGKRIKALRETIEARFMIPKESSEQFWRLIELYYHLLRELEQSDKSAEESKEPTA